MQTAYQSRRSGDLLTSDCRNRTVSHLVCYMHGLLPTSPEKPHVICRAIEIAKSGEVSNLTALRRVLRREKYGADILLLFGKGMKRQLIALIAEARNRVIHGQTAPRG